jgi:phosphate transport system permease protein
MKQGVWLFRRRQWTNFLALLLSSAAAMLGLCFLLWILYTTLRNGLNALGPHLFVQMTPPPGETGGLANAMYGSVLMCGLAVLLGAPLGVLAGTYVAEYARGSWLGSVIRFVNDVLLSAPSIVLGLFVYALLVKPMGGFSALAGAVSLAFIVLPVVVRTSDEMLRLIPQQMREAALSLGIPQWKVTWHVLYRAALPGITTGILLALARISGETAPLLFTALNNQFWSHDLTQPIASLPVVIFQYAMSPFEDWQALAWAGALLVTLFVLTLSLIARWIVGSRRLQHD